METEYKQISVKPSLRKNRGEVLVFPWSLLPAVLQLWFSQFLIYPEKNISNSNIIHRDVSLLHSGFVINSMILEPRGF